MNMQSVNDILWDAYLPQIIQQHRHSAATFRAAGDEEIAVLEENLAAWLGTASREEITAGFARVAEAERLAHYETLKKEFG